MGQVFISYYRDGSSDFAGQVKESIESKLDGIECWIDTAKMRGGKEWRREIETQIQNSDVVLLIVTPEALKRDWVLYEWFFAHGAGKTVIPLIETVPGKEHHPRLDDLHWRLFIEGKSPEWEGLISDLEDIFQISELGIHVPPKAHPFIKDAVGMLNTANSNNWKEAIETLKNSDDPDASKVLEETAKRHQNPQTRHQAAIAHAIQTKLSGFVWPVIEDAALNGMGETKEAAWGILGALGGNKSVNLLKAAFDRETNYDHRNILIKMIARAGRNRDTNAEQLLEEIISKSPAGTIGRQKEIASIALAQIREKKSGET